MNTRGDRELVSSAGVYCKGPQEEADCWVQGQTQGVQMGKGTGREKASNVVPEDQAIGR
jgi:hypothetical protein